MKRIWIFGAMALAATVAACDTRRATGLDTVPPSVELTTPGINLDSVDISSKVSVTLTAHDNLSLLQVGVVESGAAGAVLALDTTFHAATLSFVRQIPVTLGNVVSGQTVTIIAGVSDGAGNLASDTLVITIFDPTAPTVTVSAPPAGSVLRAGAAVTISTTATDAAGVARLGYEILQVAPSGLETIFKRDSAAAPLGLTTFSRSFATTIPDTLLPASYFIRGFATDVSGNRGVSSPVSIIVQDAAKPGLALTSPPADTNVTLGGSIVAVAHLTDNVGIARFSLIGISTRGDPDLGVVDTIVKYDSVFAPVNVGGSPRSFRAGLRDTIVSRLVIPKATIDSSTEPVYFVARVTDASGNDSVLVRRVQIVSGPNIVILSPGAKPVASPGKSIVVQLRGVDNDGVRQLGYRIVSPTFNLTRTAPQPAVPPDTLLFTDTLVVPASFPTGTTFRIDPFGTDNLGQPGSGASLVVTVVSPASDNQGPIVFQTIPQRVEVDDSISIRAIDAGGIQWVGFEMHREDNGALIRRDSILLGGTFTDVQTALPINAPTANVGTKVYFISFARDAAGNRGFSAPSGATLSVSDVTLAKRDTTLVVYGRTYSLPKGGTGADIAVDTLRRVAFISNLTFDRVEIWQGATTAFNAKTVAVGADPWGMAVDISGDTLLVANSGGTNVSRVFIGTADPSAINEVPARRIKTPNSLVFDVSVSVESGIARYKITITDFSDRPQFIAQTTTGEIYFSTKPTPTAPDGTIRHYDPNFPSPDVQLMWQYGTSSGTSNVAVINADNVFAIVSPVETVSDTIVVCDHPYGSGGPTTCFASADFGTALGAAQAAGGDLVGVSGLDVKSLGLTDTTFVAVGGDRRWVAFGEGNTLGSRAGRVMMAKNPGAFFSPGTSVSDLTNNASEKVFGLAINKNSTSLAARGSEAYFAEIDDPFHLRLQGKYTAVAGGAGIAFHPQNTGAAGALDDPTRVAFVASADGTVEIVDSFHYLGRGKLPVRANLYGPIRVTGRFASDDPAVVLKLFGLTTEGLIVIDIRAGDIKNVSGP